MIQDSPNISLELLLQLLSIFEGISLWKLSAFAIKETQNIDYVASFESLWNKENGFSKKFFTVMFFSVFIFIFNIINYLVWLLKWTPYLFAIGIPCFLLFLVCCFSINLEEKYLAYKLFISIIVFLFIVIKFVINIGGACYNYFFMKKYKSEIIVKEPQTKLNPSDFTSLQTKLNSGDFADTSQISSSKKKRPQNGKKR